MKYIDKTLHQVEGERIVSDFLQCVHDRLGAYPEELYKSFGQEIDDVNGHKIFLKRLQTEILEPEQKGICCYCLRRLDGCRKRTMEHLIPNHTKDQTEMDQYRTRPTVLDELVLCNIFTSAVAPVYPPFPHSVAYQNMVVSCDGDLFNENSKAISCNLKRKHKFIPPLPLFNDISSRFVYSSYGVAEWLDDPNGQVNSNSVVVILGLNKPILRMIRRIWFHIAKNGIDVFSVNRSELIYEMYGCWVGPTFSADDFRMLFNFKVDKYWTLLLQYDAFAKISPV